MRPHGRRPNFFDPASKRKAARRTTPDHRPAPEPRAKGVAALFLIGPVAVFTAVTAWITPKGEVAPDVYFAQCDDARAAGVAPMRRGEPGYRSGLDGDGDGKACEPYWR